MARTVGAVNKARRSQMTRDALLDERRETVRRVAFAEAWLAAGLLGRVELENAAKTALTFLQEEKI